MTNHNSSISGEKHLVVRRGRVDSVDLYEVKEHELELLEKGSPATLQLNFSIFLFSISLTCIVALSTCTFKWDRVETVFVFASVIGILLGTYLMISWWRTRTSIANVISCINSRIADEVSSEPEVISADKETPDSNELPSG